MSKSSASPRELIDRLDARHDELIERLDELNAQIERALAQVYRARGASRPNETATNVRDVDELRAA
jgi:tetrahydromethanopterin S-methyltransferase subunit G